MKIKSIFAFIISVLMLTALLPTVAFAADETFTASFGAQFDKELNEEVGEWPDLSDFDVEFTLGAETTITLEFDEPVALTGNFAGLNTDAPYPDNTGDFISIKLDGVEISKNAAYVNSEGIDGGVRLTLFNAWNSDILSQPVDIANFSPFTKLEITFVINEDDGTAAAAVPVVVEAPPAATGGNAIIGGTFYDEEGVMEWVRFDQYAVPFEVGKPFSVVVDLGSETNTHGAASWGFITVIQTDMDTSPAGLDAYIERITVDGNNVMFNADNIEISNERGEGGIRISLTNGWADDPVVLSHERIGEFSKFEVVMAFVSYGDPRPDFSAFALAPADDDDDDDEGGFPMWAFFAFGGAAVAIIIAVVAASKKKK
jgi:hypothetical protein